MSTLQLCILASGSAGNASLVRTPEAIFLIDCGIPPRVAQARMNRLGLDLTDIAAICLTHLDHDHFNPAWAGPIAQLDIPLFCAVGEMVNLLARAGEADLTDQLRPFDTEPFQPAAGVTAAAIPLAHDEAGSHGFHLAGFGARVGYATDLGHVPAALIEQFCGVDLLAIESNYDPELQRLSGRPMFLQRRITGGRGHLSNAQALSAVQAMFDRCQRRGHRLPRHVVLLHRSRRCNCPDLLRDTFAADPRLDGRLVLAEQHRSTAWLDALPEAPVVQPLLGQQLTWAWG